MDVTITPRLLTGSVTPPPSKSMAHRLLLAAALGGGAVTVGNVALSEDIAATLGCLESLGARWERTGDGIRIAGIGGRRGVRRPLPRFDCGESGSTLRFLIPIALAVSGGGVFTGRGRLMERPQQPYFELFADKGIFYEQRDGVLTVRGRLTPGEYRLPGNVSSQFFTGLLLALPLLDGPSALISTTALESSDYLAMTVDAMAGAGVAATPVPGGFRIAPARYRPVDRTVESDWSQAAFWLAAASGGSGLKLEGLPPRSVQGDRVAADLLAGLARPGDREIDVSGCPDLLPPLAAAAAVRRGTTRFTHAARLRLKESDRLKTTAALLSGLGGTAVELPEGLVVEGMPILPGGTVDGANDHRIVMAAAVAACRCAGPVTILGAEAVNKSYPSFFDEYIRLGGAVHVL